MVCFVEVFISKMELEPLQKTFPGCAKHPLEWVENARNHQNVTRLDFEKEEGFQLPFGSTAICYTYSLAPTPARRKAKEGVQGLRGQQYL